MPLAALAVLVVAAMLFAEASVVETSSTTTVLAVALDLLLAPAPKRFRPPPGAAEPAPAAADDDGTAAWAAPVNSGAAPIQPLFRFFLLVAAPVADEDNALCARSVGLLGAGIEVPPAAAGSSPSREEANSEACDPPCPLLMSPVAPISLLIIMLVFAAAAPATSSGRPTGMGESTSAFWSWKMSSLPVNLREKGGLGECPKNVWN